MKYAHFLYIAYKSLTWFVRERQKNVSIASHKPSLSQVYQKLSYFIALGAGSGLSPIMPGTAGSVFAFLLFYLGTTFIFASNLPFVTFALGMLGLYAMAWWSIDKTQWRTKKNDAGYIVIDEIWACFLILGLNNYFFHQQFSWVFLCIFFRIFDIFKPWPIRAVDNYFKRLPYQNIWSAFGVMLDDVLAAALTLVVAYVWYQPWVT